MTHSDTYTAQWLNPGIQVMRDKIRFGKDPNNPELIHLWLIQESVIEESLSCPGLRSQHCEKQFHLLLEAVVDELVPRHWRRLCLDYIYKPLSSLRRISDGEQSDYRLRQLLSELSTSCRYVASSL